MINCDYSNFGCDGGILKNALKFIRSKGVPEASCVPYIGNNDHCQQRCKDGSQLKAFKLHDFQEISSHGNAEENMKYALSVSLSTLVSGTMVYEDLFYYSSGVYQHT